MSCAAYLRRPAAPADDSHGFLAAYFPDALRKLIDLRVLNPDDFDPDYFLVKGRSLFHRERLEEGVHFRNSVAQREYG